MAASGSPLRWLGAVCLLAAGLLPGCCCDVGPPRLSFVEVTHDRAGLHEPVRFDGSDNELPIDAYFQAYRIGSPAPGRLRTIPLLELYRVDGSAIPFMRFVGSNPNGCAAAEIYEADDADVVVGERYQLVHRASASPGELEDSGSPEGELAPYIVDFGGEPALVADIVVVEPWSSPGGGGAGGAGTAGRVGAAGAGGR